MSKFDQRVQSSLQADLDNLLEQANEARQERRNEIIAQVSEQHTDLAELEVYDELTKSQKMSYLYAVKPHLGHINDMLVRGATRSSIAKSLGVSYKALKAMIDNIPEVAEIFEIADLETIDLAEAGLRVLLHERVIEKQELDRFGNIVTLQELREPDFKAIKFTLERRTDKYSDKKVVEHKATVSTELQDLLKSMSLDELRNLGDTMVDENIIDVEVYEDE